MRALTFRQTRWQFVGLLSLLVFVVLAVAGGMAARWLALANGEHTLNAGWRLRWRMVNA